MVACLLDDGDMRTLGEDGFLNVLFVGFIDENGGIDILTNLEVVKIRIAVRALGPEVEETVPIAHEVAQLVPHL